MTTPRAARTALAVAALLGLTATAMGAFATHGLRGKLGADALGWIETGVRFHFFHALALLGVSAWLHLTPRPLLTWSAIAFALGTLLFSGSLYVMALTGVRGLGIVTPIGGLALMLGWVLLTVTAIRK